MDLKQFLSFKPSYYKNIDYARFPNAYNAIKSYINMPKIIHIVGTNAKGSTGRFLALILRANGRKVGHYTSPHIFDFNERFWLDGKNVDDKMLQNAHEMIISCFERANAQEFISALSYFEWASLLAAWLFKDCDEVIIEAGMGGEHDATNVFSKKLSIFTPIDLDHVAMLGDSLEQIALTKLNAMSAHAILCAQNAKNPLIYNIAKSIAAKNNTKLEIANFNRANKASRTYARKYQGFLRNNFYLAYFAAKKLGANFNKQILNKMQSFDLKGRFWHIQKNLIIDVGHNEHAACALRKHLENLRKKLRVKKAILIYNCFFDKDIKAVLSTLKPCFDEILVYEYDSKERALAKDEIKKNCEILKINCRDFLYSDMQKIKNHIFKKSIKSKPKKARNFKILYVVFGSFMLANAFLRDFNGTSQK